MRRVLFFSVIIFSGLQSFGQSQGPTCAQTLRLARATYEQGRLQEIEGQLANCIKSPEEGGFSKEDKALRVEAYKILCLSYIYLEEAAKADEAMLNILKTDPYFLINEGVDPAEFVALYNTFRTQPIFRIGATLGVNASQPNVSEVIFTDGGSAEYKFKVAFQFGASADLPLSFISKRLTLHGDILYQQKKFELSTNLSQGDGDNNRTVATETQTWIGLPLTIQYSIFSDKKKVKYQPYVALGVSTDLLLGSDLLAERSREGEASVEAKTYDLKPQHETLNISALIAVGAKMRIAGGLLCAEARYAYGFSEINSEELAYRDRDLYLAHGIPYTLYKLNTLSVTATYVQNIFKPKKLNRHK